MIEVLPTDAPCSANASPTATPRDTQWPPRPPSTKNVTSNLAMMVRGNATLLRTAEEQKVSPELLTPFMALMARRLADGHGDEGTTGVIDLLRMA